MFKLRLVARESREIELRDSELSLNDRPRQCSHNRQGTDTELLFSPSCFDRHHSEDAKYMHLDISTRHGKGEAALCDGCSLFL